MTAAFFALAVYFASLFLLVRLELAEQRKQTTTALLAWGKSVEAMQTMVSEAHAGQQAALTGWRDATALSVYYERRWAEEQQLQRHRHAIVILRSRFPLSERMN